MNMPAFLASAALWMAASVMAQEAPRLPCAEPDKDCVAQATRHHAVHALATWQADLARPLDARFGPAPANLVEYLNLDNILNGYPERPRSVRPDARFMADVQGAIADLPPAIWRLFQDRLIGLYFVEHLGGTGFTDFVVDRNQRPVAGYVVLDAAVLAGQTANAWASWKENTPFRPAPGYRLQARIEADADDNRRNAIQYILLHELGHVLSIGGTIHPPWNLEPKDVPASENYPYFDLSWRVARQENRYTSRFDADFPQRTDVAYYFGAKLDATAMAPTYANLEKTNFPSLYAATIPGDDFAEAFASYVHVVLMQRPWRITLSRDGEAPMRFDACWSAPRCAAKRAVLERILARPAE